MSGWELSVAKSLWGKVGPWLWSRLRSWLIGRRFKQVFGAGVERAGFTLVYAELALASALSEMLPFSYVKPGGNAQARFSISRPVSLSELRAAGYLASAIGNAVGCTPTLRSDADVQALLDLDCVSFGGPESNFKSRDCQLNLGNRLAKFDQQVTQFLDSSTNDPLAVGPKLRLWTDPQGPPDPLSQPGLVDVCLIAGCTRFSPKLARAARRKVEA